MKEIERYNLLTGLIQVDLKNGKYIEHSVHLKEVEQLQARIKELESEISKLGATCEEYSWKINKLEHVNHINEIKAQGIDEFDKYFIEPELNSAGISMNDYNIYDILHESIQTIIKQLRTKHD